MLVQILKGCIVGGKAMPASAKPIKVNAKEGKLLIKFKLAKEVKPKEDKK